MIPTRFREERDALSMEPRALTRKLCHVLVALVATLAASMLLSGCITVPAGYEPATTHNAAIIDIVTDDVRSIAAEQAPFFATLKDGERTRLFGEMFDAVAGDLSETSDTTTLRPAFIAYGKAVDETAAAFDKPLDLWLSRLAENERRLRDAAANERAILEAMKAAQTNVEGANVSPR